MKNSNLPYWLASLYLQGVGPRKFFRWLEHFPSVRELFQASLDEQLAAGIPEKYAQLFKTPNWSAVEKDLAWSERPNHHLITYDDPAYPQSLKQISDPPLVLYIQGDPSILSKPQLAIVGSRNATPAGLQNAEHFAYYLAQAGFVITSGLALGVDAASHRGALSANGLTVGVAGTGLNHIYPSSHKSLVDQIINNQGAIISEFTLSTLPQPMNFPRRNRIIGGLSSGVLVVEAALKSGSLITARHALEHNREVFAIPGSIHHPLARGCHHLIRQGAKLVETAADILEELGNIQTSKVASNKSSVKIPDHLDERSKNVLAHIQYDLTPIDVVIFRTGLTASEVSSILLYIELQGYIQSVPGGYTRVATNQ